VAGRQGTCRRCVVPVAQSPVTAGSPPAPRPIAAQLAFYRFRPPFSGAVPQRRPCPPRPCKLRPPTQAALTRASAVFATGNIGGSYEAPGPGAIPRPIGPGNNGAPAVLPESVGARCRLRVAPSGIGRLSRSSVSPGGDTGESDLTEPVQFREPSCQRQSYHRQLCSLRRCFYFGPCVPLSLKVFGSVQLIKENHAHPQVAGAPHPPIDRRRNPSQAAAQVIEHDEATRAIQPHRRFQSTPGFAGGRLARSVSRSNARSASEYPSILQPVAQPPTNERFHQPPALGEGPPGHNDKGCRLNASHMPPPHLDFWAQCTDSTPSSPYTTRCAHYPLQLTGSNAGGHGVQPRTLALRLTKLESAGDDADRPSGLHVSAGQLSMRHGRFGFSAKQEHRLVNSPPQALSRCPSRPHVSRLPPCHDPALASMHSQSPLLDRPKPHRCEPIRGLCETRRTSCPLCMGPLSFHQSATYWLTKRKVTHPRSSISACAHRPGPPAVAESVWSPKHSSAAWQSPQPRKPPLGKRARTGPSLS